MSGDAATVGARTFSQALDELRTLLANMGEGGDANPAKTPLLLTENDRNTLHFMLIYDLIDGLLSDSGWSSERRRTNLGAIATFISSLTTREDGTGYMGFEKKALENMVTALGASD